MSEMGDYINSVVLGVGRVQIESKAVFVDRDDGQIQRMLASSRRHNYPEPEIFMSEFGYKRARCPECRQDFAIRGGYLRHYGRAHKPAKPLKKVEVFDQEVFDNPVEDATPEAEWRARARASHDRIIKRFSKAKVVV
jgi:uncharacterized C2H2 Zn-finger protein